MRTIQKLVVLTILCFSAVCLAQVAEVRERSANLYEQPSLNSRVLGTLKSGKRVRLTGKRAQGFSELKTKSGKSVWIQSTSLLGNIEDDLVEVEDQMPIQRKGPIVTWDLGFSSGSAGDVNYSEATLGINTFFKEWIAWRNSVFYRFVSLEGVDDFYGLDTMARLYHRVSFSRSSGLTLFGGPGYRFVNEGDNVPFAEGGLILQLGGLSLGGGVKSLFTTWVNDDAEDDTQFFIILSGSGIF